ncbi:MAG TPA: cupin domain-containing protein [Herpetosiphonaceae bacterium]|nr:cupin domain-containing protein [Herpetosiphonaceae bacterium]
MIRPGFTIENPVTRLRTLVLETEAETNGGSWLVEHHSAPHAGPQIPEHVHLTWTETFEIISGRARYKLNGVQSTAEAGETIVMPPRQYHVHPWNAGETELVYRQRTTFQRPDLQAMQDVLGMVATAAGLAREGKVDKQGQPRNPLQLLAMLKTLNKYDLYDAKLPIPVQKLLSVTLGSLAEALGYRATYPRFVGND